MGSLGFSETFLLTDIKLGLGLVTVALAGSLFLIEKKFPFNEAFNMTVVILLAYFLFSGALYFLTSSKKYKNVKYTGVNDSGKKIEIVAGSPKFNPIYEIEIRYENQVSKTSVEFTKLFDTFTSFHPEALKEELAKEIAKIDKKDI